MWSDPSSPQRQFAPAILAYNSSKTALNAVVVAYANALADEGIKVNATIPADGPTGAFLSDDGLIPW